MTRLSNALLAALAGCTALSAPALALQEPTRGKDDQHVCTAAYKPSQVLALRGQDAMTTTVEFPPTENVEEVAVSDTAHLKRARSSGVLWLKPTRAQSDPEPISVRTTSTKDGSAKLYVFQWTASAAPSHQSAVSAADGAIKLANTGAPVTVSAASDAPPPCYVLHISDPVAECNAKVAAWRERQAKLAEIDTAERLKRNPAAQIINRNYVGQGDMRPVPKVWSDGNTTFVQFGR